MTGKSKKNTNRAQKRSGQRQQITRPSRAINCSLICPGDGATMRLPDGVGSRSVPLESVSRLLLTANADGDAGCIICPSSSAALSFNDPTYSAGVVTNWNSASTSSVHASLISNISELRVVACTILVTYVGDSYSNGGEISVKGFTPTTIAIGGGAVPNDVPRQFGDIASPSYYGRASHGVSTIALVNDDIEMRKFNGPSQLDVEILRGLKSYAIFLQGCNTATPQFWAVTIRQTMEIVPDARNWLSRMAIPAPVRNNGLLTRLSQAFHALTLDGNDIVTAAEQVSQAARVALSLGAAFSIQGGRLLGGREL